MARLKVRGLELKEYQGVILGEPMVMTPFLLSILKNINLRKGRRRKLIRNNLGIQDHTFL